MAQKGAIIKEIVVAKSINFLKSFIKLKIMIIGKKHETNNQPKQYLSLSIFIKFFKVNDMLLEYPSITETVVLNITENAHIEINK